MDIKEKEEIKKEFQLERVVLFSDAVFAIIITIMVIEIKVPEGLRHASHEKLHEAFIELLPKIGGYLLAFFITANFWAKHLKLFSYLKDYTRQLIAYNLIFLFFISLFPFAVSVMTETLNPRNFEGLLVYMIVIMFAFFSQTLLTSYLVNNAKELCIMPDDIKVNLDWRAQKTTFILIPLLFLYTLAGLYYNFNPTFFGYGYIAWAMMFGIIRKRLSSKKTHGEPFLARLFKSRKRQQVKPAETAD